MRDFRFAFYSIAVLGLNLASIVLGLVYLVFPGQSVFWDFCGWLFLASWISTIILFLFVTWNAGSVTIIGEWVSLFGYVTLAVLGFSAFVMFGASFLLSISVSELGGPLAVLYGGFFVCTVVNSFFAFMVARQFGVSSDSASHVENKIGVVLVEKVRFLVNRRVLFVRVGVLLVCAVVVGLMLYFAVLCLAGVWLGAYSLSEAGVFNGVMGVVSGSFGWLFSVLAWSAAAGGVKILRRLRLPRVSVVFGLLGLLVGSILLGPMLAVPLMASDVDIRFGEAYGTDWESRIPVSALPYLKSTQLVAADYFLPRPLGDCVVLKNISFFNGSGEFDSGLQLFFDAYLPPSNSGSLPGANSVIIRIHGGGWTTGDKGIGNMPLMNRYFAAQGYCVFDIQYGLSNESRILSFLQGLSPENVRGNYSINDMVGHVGLFCKYLEAHHGEYNANLDSVFISGGSAGGHLTCVAALAIAGGDYSSLFGSGITIKGFVPFYPANNAARAVDGGISNPEFYDPTLLVSADSPPCLVYQGSQDGLVDPQGAQNLKNQYTSQGNRACMVVTLPFAGHGSDIAFYGYYNQFFLYYMERFLYLHR